MRKTTLFLATLLLCGSLAEAGEGAGRFLVRNLSNNDVADGLPQIDGTTVVWRSDVDGDDEIWRHDGRVLSNISNHNASDRDVSISGSSIVWRSDRDGDWDIYRYDGQNVSNISNNNTVDQAPQISGQYIAWEGHTNLDPAVPSDEIDWDIYRYDGSSITNLSDELMVLDRAGDRTPKISGSNVVWRRVRFDSPLRDLYFYPGHGDAVMINPWEDGGDNLYYDISGDHVVWEAEDFHEDMNPEGDVEVYLFDGASTVNLTNSGWVGEELAPKISGSNVVYMDDSDIYLHGAEGRINLSNNAGFMEGPEISGTNVAWEGPPDGTFTTDIFFSADEGQPINVSNTEGSYERFVEISGKNLAWIRDFEEETEVYAAYWMGPYANLENVELGGEDFAGLDLTASRLSGSTITAAQLRSTWSASGVDLTGHNFSGEDLSDVDLSAATLDNVNFSGADLSGADLAGSTVTAFQLRSAASVSGVDLTGHHLPGENLSGIDLSYAVLAGAELTEANLPNADLSYGALNSVLLKRANLKDASLAYAKLTNANLIETNLSGADLAYADLSNAGLIRASLKSATLSYAKLVDADLTQANLAGADLVYADFTGADLTGAILIGSIGLLRNGASQLGLTPLETAIVDQLLLHGANFSGANLSGVVLDHPSNDLLDAQGWANATWAGAFFDYRDPPQFPEGMIHAAHGIAVRTPEPAAILLALFGLALLPRRRRR